MNKRKQKLTIDRPAAYDITVPGAVEAHSTGWDGEMEVKVESDEDEQPVTTLSAIVDQAGLLGLLRSLISRGLPLISVIFTGDDDPER